MAQGKAPSSAWYLVSVALAIAGCVSGALILWHAVTGLAAVRAFAVPGSHVIEVRAPGRYALWHDHATHYGGEVYSFDPRLPSGVRIRVVGPQGPVALHAPRGRSTSKVGTAERIQINVFDAPVAGRYEIEVQGDFPRRILSVGPDNLLSSIAQMFGAFAALMLGGISGVALATWVYFRREAVVARESAGGVNMKTQTSEGGTETDNSRKQLTQMVYALQAASFLVGFSGIAAVIVNYVKRDDVAGTLYESHFRWQIRTFWWSLLWAVLGALLALVVVGFVILAADAIWFIYRIIKGWLNLNDGKPMPG